MIGAPIDSGFVIFLLIVSSVVCPIASLVIINVILEKIKTKQLFRYIVNLFFISAFLLFQQNIIKVLPLYFSTILIIECIITLLLLIYLTIKVVKIWRS